MKVKLKCLQTKHGKSELERFGVEIGGVYKVIREHGSGRVSINTPSGMVLPLFKSEFETIIED